MKPLLEILKPFVALFVQQLLWPARFNLALACSWVLAMRLTTGRLPMLAGLVDDLSAVCLIVLLLGAASKLPRRIAGVFPWVLTGIMGTYIISNDLYFAFYRGYLSPAALAHTGDAGRAAPSALMLLSWPVVFVGLGIAIAV